MAKRKTPYRSKVKIGVGPDGKAINKWIQGSTRAELDQERRKVIAYYITGEGLDQDRLFGEYAREWYKVRKEPFVAPSTRNGYRTILNKHILPVFGDRNLRAIKPMDLQLFVNGFAGTSSTQITLVMATLANIFASAVQDRLIRSNPAVGLVRPAATPPAEKRALTPEERQRIVVLFPTHPHGNYLAVMYYTGMRPGEVRGLQWGDIDWDKSLIHVQRDIDYADHGRPGRLKTRQADRYVPLAAPLRALLEPVRQAPAAYIFPGEDGRAVSESTARLWWIRLMIDCDLAVPLPPDQVKKGKGIRGQYELLITPHAMRHNFITMCWEKGVDIMLTMHMVGHSDYSTTRNIYTHLSAAHLETARAELDSIFAPKVASKLHHPEATEDAQK